MRLDGKVALITGGESGIGLATARRFLTEGARVVVAGLDDDALRAAGEELGPSGRFHISPCDVCDEDEVADVVAAIGETIGKPIDIVFSNAGTAGPVAPVVHADSIKFDRVLAVHVLGAFHVAKHAIPAMRDGGAFIINSSVSGLLGLPNLAAYAAAKHAQVGLMRSLAAEVTPRRIRVTTINPGPVDTPFQRRIEEQATGLPQPQAGEVFAKRIPLGRHGTPEDVAALVAFLASDEAAWITGTTISVDGGMRG